MQNIFQAPVGNIAQNSDHFSQTTHVGIPPQDLKKFVTDFTDHLDELTLDQGQRRKAEVQLATIKAQLDDPNPIIVTEASRTLRNITEGAIGSLLATAAQPTVWQWIHRVLKEF